jgi:hypothetical protein
MPRRRAKPEPWLFSLPSEIFQLIMENLVRLHATAKPLGCFLLTTKQLCRPRYKLYRIVVKTFVKDYISSLTCVIDKLGEITTHKNTNANTKNVVVDK